MAFQRGISGNKKGRPKGSKNKAGEELRNLISSFLEQQFDRVIKDFDKIDSKDRIKVFIDLLQYSVPKLQSVSNDVKFEHLSTEDLDKIIASLKEGYE